MKTKRIAELNDSFRRDFIGGIVVMSAGVRQISPDERCRIFDKISGYADFNTGNDPYGEHDFGVVIEGIYRVYWKIDYYDLSFRQHSKDPADIEITNRVMTIMLAREY